MKLDFKKLIKICGCIFVLFLCIHYWDGLVRFVGKVLSAALPLILGGIIAFIVNILMSTYEKWFFPKKQQGAVAKMRRPVCLILAFLTAILVIALVIWLIVPQLISCIQLILGFAAKIPDYIKEFVKEAKNWKFIPPSILESLANIDWESRIGQFVQLVTTGVGGVVNTVAKTVMGVFSGIVMAVLGLIFSVYLLLEKDNLKRQSKKVMETYLPKKIYSKVFYFLGTLNESCRKFFVGQLTEAVILGILCTIGMLIFRLPYATMIGALIAFTALIPVAGAYIGAIVGALMIMTVSPIKALWFLVFIVVLQQLEGNIIYPRVVGSSIGLPGIWVLAAVTIGGGCFGIAGMLVGVPLTSALYRIISDDIKKREVTENAPKVKKTKKQKPKVTDATQIAEEEQKN
ncbi:MAG: AI-2E family transporter [Clostridia bacterium]|nr:AI-2E family transporter [Clostridia bacterium]